MQFTVSNSALVDALGWVAKSLPLRPTAPVLAGVKLSVTGNLLTLSAYDYEQSAVAQVEVDGATDGVVVVSGRMFSDIARALPEGDVKITVDGTRLLVQARSSKFSLAIMPDGEYPSLPSTPPTVGTVQASEFSEAVRKVVAAAGKDDTLPVLTAVQVTFDADAGVITFAATDRFRLAVVKVPFTAAAGVETIKVLVPSRTLDLWAKSLGAKEGDIFALGTGGGEQEAFSITAGHRSATVRLLDGQFPAWQSLIPSDFNAETTINSADLLTAVKRVAIVAQTSRAPVKVEFAKSGLTISASSDGDASEDIDAEHVGAEITMGFNSSFLSDGLGAIGGADMRVSLVAANKPVIIQPQDSDAYTYLLMPMRG